MIVQKRQYWRSLAGGEIAPEMYGRLDLPKWQTGVQTCLNFSVTPQGALENRSGSLFVDETDQGSEVGKEAVLRTYVSPNGTGYLLCFSSQYVAIYSKGARSARTQTGYTMAVNRKLSLSQFSESLLMCSHHSYPKLLQRDPQANTWSIFEVSFTTLLSPPTALEVDPYEVEAMEDSDPRITYSYRVSTVATTGAESSWSEEETADNMLRIAGTHNDLSWGDPASLGGHTVEGYRVYAGRNSGGYGFIGYTKKIDGVPPTFVDDNIAPDFLTQPPEQMTAEDGGALFRSLSNYPAVAVYFQQRAVYAGTEKEPQTFWASGLAGFSYFKTSVPPQDDQAFTFELSARRAAPITHVIASQELLFFTTSGVFRVAATDATGAFSPLTVGATLVSTYGAEPKVDIQEVGSRLLFPLERGGHLMSLVYDGAADSYQGEDLSLVAPHLIDGYTWVQTAFQQAPYPVWWGARSDGALIGLTYIQEQQIYAWFRYDLGAPVESVTVVPEGEFDVVYVVVKRKIAGVTRRYIEKLPPRISQLETIDKAAFLDSHVNLINQNVSVITGLAHLEGETVYALVGGRPRGPFVVENGAIDLGESAGGARVIVGLPFVSRVETLPLMYEMAAYGTGVAKNVSSVSVRVKRSAGLEAGVEPDALRQMQPPADELLGDPPTIRDGVHRIDVDPNWDENAYVIIEQRQPLPATITGLAVDFEGAE